MNDAYLPRQSPASLPKAKFLEERSCTVIFSRKWVCRESCRALQSEDPEMLQGPHWLTTYIATELLVRFLLQFLFLDVFSKQSSVLSGICKMNRTGFSWKKVKVTRGTLVLHPSNWMGNGADRSFVCFEGQLDYKSLNYQNPCCFLAPPLPVPHQTLLLDYLPCKRLWLLFRCCGNA